MPLLLAQQNLLLERVRGIYPVVSKPARGRTIYVLRDERGEDQKVMQALAQALLEGAITETEFLVLAASL